MVILGITGFNIIRQ